MARGILAYAKSMLKERPHWLIPVVGSVCFYKKCIALGMARKEPMQEAKYYGAGGAALFESARLGLPMIFPAVQYVFTGHASMDPSYWVLVGASYFGFTAIFSEMGEAVDSSTLEAKLKNNGAVA